MFRFSLLILFSLLYSESSENLTQMLKSSIIAKYKDSTPTQFGENLNGVITHFKTNKKELALTLDACGGRNGSNLDHNLINLLKKYNIKATLFINQRWIKANKKEFLELAKNPLFEIANHGTKHLPLATTSKTIYGIHSTNSLDSLINEVLENENLIYELSGKLTPFFRSGTAYYDDVALLVLKDLGFNAIGFSFSADFGATLSEKGIIKQMLNAKSGDIILAHMNHPESNVANAFSVSLPKLLDSGFEFVHLSNVREFY